MHKIKMQRKAKGQCKDVFCHCNIHVLNQIFSSQSLQIWRVTRNEFYKREEVCMHLEDYHWTFLICLAYSWSIIACHQFSKLQLGHTTQVETKIYTRITSSVSPNCFVMALWQSAKNNIINLWIICTTCVQ